MPIIHRSSPPTAPAPIEAKTANNTLVGSLVFVVAGYLCVYVFHLDASKTAIITGAAPILVGFAAAYMTHHTPRLREIVSTVTEELAQMGYMYEEPAQNEEPPWSEPDADVIGDVRQAMDHAERNPYEWLDTPTVTGTAINAADLGIERPEEQEDPYEAGST